MKSEQPGFRTKDEMLADDAEAETKLSSAIINYFSNNPPRTKSVGPGTRLLRLVPKKYVIADDSSVVKYFSNSNNRHGPKPALYFTEDIGDNVPLKKVLQTVAPGTEPQIYPPNQANLSIPRHFEEEMYGHYRIKPEDSNIYWCRPSIATLLDIRISTPEAMSYFVEMNMDDGIVDALEMCMERRVLAEGNILALMLNHNKKKALTTLIGNAVADGTLRTKEGLKYDGLSYSGARTDISNAGDFQEHLVFLTDDSNNSLPCPLIELVQRASIKKIGPSWVVNVDQL